MIIIVPSCYRCDDIVKIFVDRFDHYWPTCPHRKVILNTNVLHPNFETIQDRIDPWLLFVCLNSPIVRKQIRAKQFTQDIIDTLDKRINESILPIPKNRSLCEQIARETKETILARVQLRNRARQIALEVEGITQPVPVEEGEGTP